MDFADFVARIVALLIQKSVKYGPFHWFCNRFSLSPTGC